MPYNEYLKTKSKLKVYTYFWDPCIYKTYYLAIYQMRSTYEKLHLDNMAKRKVFNLRAELCTTWPVKNYIKMDYLSISNC